MLAASDFVYLSWELVIPPFRVGDIFGEMKLNEPGRQKLGR